MEIVCTYVVVVMHEFHGVLDPTEKFPHSISHQFKKCGVEHLLSANICIKICAFFFLFRIHLLCSTLHVWDDTHREKAHARARMRELNDGLKIHRELEFFGVRAVRKLQQHVCN